MSATPTKIAQTVKKRSSYLSKQVATLRPSGIRKFFDIVATMDDVISLGIGEPDFTTPDPILEAGIRSLQKARFNKELKIIRDVFNDAWSQNWGFVPWTNAEFAHLAKDLKMLVEEDLVHIAEADGEPAAFIVGLPNVNEAIRDLNGRLLPFGWLKLLWRLKVKYPQTGRVPLMGVRSKYHDSMLGAALAFGVIAAVQDAAIRHGLQKMELSWILEDNMGMRNILEAISGRVYKTYRIYSKNL